MNKRTSKVLNEVKLAYCDSTKPWEIAKDLRNLDFRATYEVSVPDAVSIMTQALGLDNANDMGYNAFSPSLLNFLPADCKVIIAREGSVCVYVETNEELTQKLANKMSADEFNKTSHKLYRFWWD